MTGSDIRQKFLEYFQSKGHEIVPSSPLVPKNDPTLLFANAGMNQFKDTFLGSEKREYSRATTCQKVVRAGGKHNDLENVGRTSRHHTFFEMLGNFSFGDYFKEDAIKFGWDFLVNVVGLPADKMFVSIYKDDEEAFEIWRDVIGVAEENIERRGEKDNFWSMGDTGPCGPCSEIHIDQGEHTGCRRPECDRDCECDRHLELWNLVFMQFNRDESGEMTPLPKPSIDTGMGLERIASVVQGVTSNYDTDLIKPIIEFTAELAGIKYGADTDNDVSLRVIADHSRAATFLIADGVMPSNEGRGYVLRRIMRRAMRHGKMLGFEGTFFHKVCSFVIDFMKGHYIELADKRSYIEKVVTSEEEQFGKTLSIGMKLIAELFEKYGEKKEIPGNEIFRLYDTYGFPVDLLEDMAEDSGFALDMTGFNKEMAEQQERAKKSWSSAAYESVSGVYSDIASELKQTPFIGYSDLERQTVVKSIIVNGERSERADGEAELVLESTPFYAEGGGQAGDIGTIKTENALFRVKDTKRYGDGLIVHTGKIELGSIAVGEEVTASVDEEARAATERNHTATHLLHKALQTVLGDHVRQAGSLVSPDRLRFDFTHFAQVTPEEIERIEALVNERVMVNSGVAATEESIESAMEKGAMALFGEKYGDTVRVVEVPGFSLELCGGCHVDRTGDIGLFKIISETSVASGIRRIEALTGKSAVDYVMKNDRVLKQLSLSLKSSVDSVENRVDELNETIRKQEREIRKLNDRLNSSKADDLLKNVIEVKGVKLLTARMDGADTDALRNFIDTARDKMKSGVALAASADENKVTFICGVTKDLTDKIKAGSVIKEVASIAGGGGGGRPDMAQAGGKKPEKTDEALGAAPAIVEGMLG
ncbi:alanine--tRNA ligase [Limisalsivibrio acetivorans]|uniref:alanine--tRNA ligase n=1 Tax=Limisalsivibrio acetivorans TaxID=1304888 RepID=UPI0003B49C99|nr:alanine--tRNA ligase [Limisalsivibrio acetivorans]